MLKITAIYPSDHQCLLLLEGRLIGPWVPEVERICREKLDSQLSLRLDMSGVTYADAGGTDLLWRLTGEKKVAIENCTAFVQEQLRGEPTSNLIQQEGEQT